MGANVGLRRRATHLSWPAAAAAAVVISATYVSSRLTDSAQQTPTIVADLVGRRRGGSAARKCLDAGWRCLLGRSFTRRRSRAPIRRRDVVGVGGGGGHGHVTS